MSGASKNWVGRAVSWMKATTIGPLGSHPFRRALRFSASLSVTTSRWIRVRVSHTETIRNFRTPEIDLGSLYGRGPGDSPYLYESPMQGG